MMWTRACSLEPTNNISPSTHGWKTRNGMWTQLWYEGDALPQSLLTGGTASTDADPDEELQEEEPERSTGTEDYEDECWSEDSDEEWLE